jgi:glycosyltransferase involved in cell wall biosynthesis
VPLVPPKVVHLVCPAATGGAETVVRLLASARRRRGFDTEVIAITGDGPDHPFVNELRGLGVPITVRPPLGRRYLREVAEVADVVRRLGADVVHTHVYRADYIGYFAARKVGAAAVATFHGETAGDLMNRFYEWSVKRLFRRFDAVVCVSERNREKLRAAGSDLANAHLVRNGAAFEAGLDRAEARAQLGLAGTETVVGWIGRLSGEKGPDLLLDAVEAMGDPGLTVVFVGEGPMRPELEARAGRLRSRVIFAGSVINAARFIRAFDVVAMTGRMEGMPMVMLESMSARVPVAGFLVGGIPEVLSEKTGWPAPPEDAPALGLALAAALRERDASSKRALAAEALVRREYSLDSWVDAMERVYAAALSRK